MAAMTTTTLHERADAAAHKGDFENALRFSAEALRVVPADARARLKVALCLAAYGKTDRAVKALVVCAEVLARRGFMLQAIGACRDALGLASSAADVTQELESIHARIHGLEGRGRSRVPPPAPPVRIDENAEDSFLKITDANALIDRALQLATTDPDRAGESGETCPVPLFSDLSKPAFTSLVQKMGYLKVPANHAVVREGEQGQSLFILVQGEVEVSRGAKDERQVMARLGAGSLFGELALIRAKPRGATVMTLQPSELFEIGRASVEEVAASNATITEELVQFARRRLIMNLMATSRIFTPFDDAQRLQILKVFVSRLVEKGAGIIEEGKPPSGLYIVLEGEVEVSKIDEAGEKVVLAYLREGEVFGEIALLEKGLTTATVTASDKSVVLYLDRGRFGDFVKEHPKIKDYLASLSDARIEENKVAMSADGVVLEADDLIIM
jgi:CRP-like cAMP-binding protein